MKNIYFTVGPSQLYPTVKQHIRRALKDDILSISHRGKQFAEIYQELSYNLRELLRIPSTHHIFFTGNSIESMERIIANTVEEKSFHIMTGEFANRFYQIACDLNKKTELYHVPLDKQFTISELQIPTKTELLCITENETSVGLQLPLEGIKEIKKRYPKLIICVDIVSSAPYSDINYEYVDIAFFSVQKGFGLPAGLGVLIVNDVAIAKTYELLRKKILIGNKEFSFATQVETERTIGAAVPSGTPNVFDIYLLAKLTRDFCTVGIKNLREESRIKAAIVYKYFDAHSEFKPLMPKNFRSITTPVIQVNGKAEEITKVLDSKGLIISKGYRQYNKDHIRIANFPAHSVADMEKLISAFKKIY